MVQSETVKRLSVKFLQIAIGVTSFVLIIHYDCFPTMLKSSGGRSHLPGIVSVGLAGASLMISLLCVATYCWEAPRKEFVMIIFCIAFSLISGILHILVYTKRNYDNSAPGIGVGGLQIFNALLYILDGFLIHKYSF